MTPMRDHADPEIPDEAADGSKRRSGKKKTPRAPKACLACRARKVRCDVAYRGRPCNNCQLDGAECVVTRRASHPLTCRRDSASGQPADGPDLGSLAVPPEVSREEDPLYGRDAALLVKPEGAAFDAQPPSVLSQPDDRQSTNAEQPGGASIKYSSYPFLTANNIHNIPAQDVSFLEQQGCLQVPVRVYLDEFLQQYFLHVHPILPFLNEGEVWDIVSVPALNGTVSAVEPMSLLVLQAIIFASCNFVSRETIQALGFESIRVARGALYRRAKLLHDLDSETSPLALAQSALILTFWSPPGTKMMNSAWLAVAIRHTRSVEGHVYASMPSFPTDDPVQRRKRDNLKRLWWCCIIRDRSVALLMRRPLQITKAHFNYHTCPMLQVEDMEDEFDRSMVYDVATKRALAEILVCEVGLFLAITDLLLLAFPVDEMPRWGQPRGGLDDDGKAADECKKQLAEWYESATARLPMYGGGNTANPEHGDEEPVHDSVILYTNFMYMYYHSARVVIYHHEILNLVSMETVNGAHPRDENASRALSSIRDTRYKLKDAATGVTQCLKELVRLKLAQFLPISAVACTALPLVLNILDVKLSDLARESDADDSSTRELKRHHLSILFEAMSTYQVQYDSVDWVSEVIRHTINLSQLNEMPSSQPGPDIKEWADILTSRPTAYLRLALVLDACFSTGTFPLDNGLPVSLRRMLAEEKPVAAVAGSKNAGAEPSAGGDNALGQSFVDEIMQDASEGWPQLDNSFGEIPLLEGTGDLDTALDLLEVLENGTFGE